MAKGNIPGYLARQPIEAFPVGAKAWPEMMSRERRAMAGFGGTVMSVAQRWQDERDNAEISRLQSTINNFQYTSLRQLEDDWRAGKFTSADQFKQAEDDYVKAREKLVNNLVKGKRGIIADRVSEYADANKASDTAGFYRNLFPKEKEFRSVEALKVIENYKVQGDRDKALMAIEQNKYWLGLTKSEVLKANLDADMAVYQKQAFLEQVTVDAREMNIIDALSAINQIPRTAITETERNGLIAQRKRQEEIATATTNRQVRWEVLRQVTKNPQSVTDEYLESLVGPDSLTWDDAEEFKKIRDDADEPLKSPRAQLYFNRLDALYVERDIDSDEGRKQALEWDISNEKLTQFFEDNPKATAKQAAEFYNELVEAEVESWWERGWEWSETSPWGSMYWYRKISPKKEKLLEPKTLVEFEDTVRLLDEEDAKAYYEKWKDKW